MASPQIVLPCLLVFCACTGDAVLGYGSASGADAGSDAATPLACAFSWDFEDGADGWTHEPLIPGASDPWVRTGTREPACHDGRSCFAVSEVGEYLACQAGQLLSPVLDLSGCAMPLVLSFWHWVELNKPSAFGSDLPDAAFVELSVDGGRTWLPSPEPEIDPYVGIASADAKKCPLPDAVTAYVGRRAWGDFRDPGWRNPHFLLGASHATAGFRMRLVFGAGGYRGARGWIVDSMSLSPR